MGILHSNLNIQLNIYRAYVQDLCLDPGTYKAYVQDLYLDPSIYKKYVNLYLDVQDLYPADI